MKRSAFLLLLLTGLAGGCSVLEYPAQVRGNRVTADQLKELVPGTSTRQDATSLLGSPTAKASFDDNTWIYISEVTQPRVGRVQGINSQDVVELSFDDRGVLRLCRAYLGLCSPSSSPAGAGLQPKAGRRHRVAPGPRRGFPSA